MNRRRPPRWHRLGIPIHHGGRGGDVRGIGDGFLVRRDGRSVKGLRAYLESGFWAVMAQVATWAGHQRRSEAHLAGAKGLWGGSRS